MFAVKEIKAFSKRISGKDGKITKIGENRQRGNQPRQDRQTGNTDLLPSKGPGPKLYTHRSGCSDDFKTFLSGDDDVVAFESNCSGLHSGDFCKSPSGWAGSSDWAPERKENEETNLQF